MKCAVLNCGNQNNVSASECSFFHFPSDEKLLKKWIRFCRREKKFNPKTAVICMVHFTSQDFENSLKYEMGYTTKRTLKRGAVPTIYKVFEGNVERAERLKRRENKQVVAMLLKDYIGSNEENEFMEVSTDDPNEIGEEIYGMQDEDGMQKLHYCIQNPSLNEHPNKHSNIENKRPIMENRIYEAQNQNYLSDDPLSTENYQGKFTSDNQSDENLIPKMSLSKDSTKKGISVNASKYVNLQHERTKAETIYYRKKAAYFQKQTENLEIQRRLMILQSQKLRLEIEKIRKDH